VTNVAIFLILGVLLAALEIQIEKLIISLLSLVQTWFLIALRNILQVRGNKFHKKYQFLQFYGYFLCIVFNVIRWKFLLMRLRMPCNDTCQAVDFIHVATRF